MLDKKLQRRFILPPLLLLIAFIGLFIAIEYRMHISNSEVRRSIEDPLLQQIHEFQDTLMDVESQVDLLFADGKPDPKKVENIRSGFKELKEREVFLAALFYNEALNAVDVYQSDLFNLVREQLKDFEERFHASEKNLSLKNWNLLREEVDILLDRTVDLKESVIEKRKQETNLILRDIDEYEQQRGMLSGFVIVSGFILIFSLLDNMRRYKENAERAMAAEHYNAIYGAALQSTRVGVLIRDMRRENTPAVFVNDAFTRMTGYSLEDTSGESSDFLFGWKTDPLMITAFRRAISLHETATFELLVYRKEGSPFWSEWHLSPVLNIDGELTHYVSLFTDITAIREVQDDLILAKRTAMHASAVKTSFLAMMSHEIRTPINGILGVLRLVEETGLSDEQRHLISIAKTSSDALHGIINDILDYAKMEAGKIELYMEVFSLRKLLDDIFVLFKTLADEKGISLELNVSDDLPEYFSSDPGRIRQILLNLLSNAVKFTDKGYIRINVISLLAQEIDGEESNLVRFEVIDTGVGISQDDQGKLFKEFSQLERSFTRRFGGTGLGLAISRRLVELFSGEIGVESHEKKGSRFWFMVPLTVVHEAPAEIIEEIPEEPFINDNHVHHILLVEDNDTNRLVAQRYLEKAGYVVEEATDGVEAIEKAKACDFDLILMDVSMPEMDGMLATCHIRSLGGHNAHVPVIALTAHVMAGDKELCLAAGMNDYLNKPLEYDALQRSLNRWLRVSASQKDVSDQELLEAKMEAPSIPDIESEILEKGSAEKAENSEQQFPVEESEGPVFESNLPDFDELVLERMVNDLGKEAVTQIVEMYIRDSVTKVPLLKDEEVENIELTAHTLKSCSANCGLRRFSELMAGIEAAVKEKDWPHLEELLKCVDATYQEGLKRLKAEKGRFTES